MVSGFRNVATGLLKRSISKRRLVSKVGDKGRHCPRSLGVRGDGLASSRRRYRIVPYVRKQSFTTSAASRPAQDREDSFNDGKIDVNVARQFKISKTVLLGISDGDIVSCPDSADVHVFRATVLGQYSAILRKFCG